MQLIEILLSLETLHARKIAHSDILLRNLLFSSSPDYPSMLIDFDLSRLVTASPPPTYPSGYNVMPPDGMRAPNAIPGSPITLMHDRISLHAIFSHITYICSITCVIF